MAEFENLELDPERTFCFGFCPLKPKGGSGGDLGWRSIANAAASEGWNNVDAKRAEEDFVINVNASYGFLCQTVMKDLDSGMEYRTAFNNDLAMWTMGIVGSAGVEILFEQAEAFFKSEYVVKFANRCADYIERGAKVVRNIMEPRICRGEMLEVPTVKLERILFLAENRHVMVDNLRGCKYRLN